MPSCRPVLLVAVALVAASCGWDGPRADVRVVPGGAEPTRIDEYDGERDVVEPVVGEGPAAAAGSDEPGAASNGDQLVPPLAAGPSREPLLVGVVGDSLTVSAEDELVDAFGAVGAEVVVDAKESRRMTAGSAGLTSGVDAIESVSAAATPDLWVIALGTNDVGAQSGSERFRDDVRTTLAALPDDAPLVWVDLWIRDRPGEIAVANALLRAELARRTAPTAVVDWHDHGDDDGLVTDDGIHLTEAGQAVFADAIADQAVELAGR